MGNEIKKLVQLNLIRDIQIAMLKKREEGLIINEDIIEEILFDLEATLRERSEEAEIDEGGGTNKRRRRSQKSIQPRCE